MMPFCAGDQLHAEFLRGNPVGKPDHWAPKSDRAPAPWRSCLAMCTLLTWFLTMTTAQPTLADAVPAREDRKPGNLSGHVTSPAWPAHAAPEGSVDGSQVRNRGLASMNRVQPVLRFRNAQQQVAQPWSHMRRRPQRVGPGLRFSNRRSFVSSVCSNKDISIFQSRDGSSGIPRYAVQIMNNCMSDCPPSDIHVFCGWFASALLVNPNSFQRIAFNDCLVNGGRPLRHGEALRFTYANSFMYPLRFKSASFCK